MTAPVGTLLRQWRARDGRSQLDLAHDVGVSPRHLSFVETGRSTPSPDLILSLARNLRIPLRERNALLTAAGFAPRYRERALDDPSMERALASVTRILGAHDPFPGVALDRQWNVVLANDSARALAAVLPAHLTTPTLNIIRAGLHPEGFPTVTRNFDDWGAYLVETLDRLVRTTGDEGLIELEREVSRYPGVAELRERLARRPAPVEPTILVPFEARLGDLALSLFTTLTTFGSPRDITLDELTIELFYPADDATEAVLRSAG